MLKVFDCCIINDEVDMLLTRLHILNDVVDYFVVCEAGETHSGEAKHFNVLHHAAKFAEFADKMIYIQIPTLSDGKRNSWDRERFHRGCIAAGWQNTKDDDWIIVADVDEIPDPDCVTELKALPLSRKTAKFELAMYYFDLNHRVTQGWAIGAARKSLNLNPNDIRTSNLDGTGQTVHVFMTAGHHLSYFGGANAIVHKVDSFMHHSDDVIRDMPRDPSFVQAKIDASLDLFGRDLKITHVPGPLPETMPHYILDNVEKYREMGWCE